jgi:hypothetical protein
MRSLLYLHFLCHHILFYQMQCSAIDIPWQLRLRIRRVVIAYSVCEWTKTKGNSSSFSQRCLKKMVFLHLLIKKLTRMSRRKLGSLHSLPLDLSTYFSIFFIVAWLIPFLWLFRSSRRQDSVDHSWDWVTDTIHVCSMRFLASSANRPKRWSSNKRKEDNKAHTVCRYIRIARRCREGTVISLFPDISKSHEDDIG